MPFCWHAKVETQWTYSCLQRRDSDQVHNYYGASMPRTQSCLRKPGNALDQGAEDGNSAGTAKRILVLDRPITSGYAFSKFARPQGDPLLRKSGVVTPVARAGCRSWACRGGSKIFHTKLANQHKAQYRFAKSASQTPKTKQFDLLEDM